MAKCISFQVLISLPSINNTTGTCLSFSRWCENGWKRDCRTTKRQALKNESRPSYTAYDFEPRRYTPQCVALGGLTLPAGIQNFEEQHGLIRPDFS